MPYVRLAFAHARPERREEVRRHFEELVRHIRTLPGCLASYVVEPHDSTGEVGRMSFWENLEAANRAANDPHAMHLHSELMFDVHGDIWDRSYEAVESADLPPASS